MADSESEQETEIFFKDAQVTVHQNESEIDSVQQELKIKGKSRSLRDCSPADSDEEVIGHQITPKMQSQQINKIVMRDYSPEECTGHQNSPKAQQYQMHKRTARGFTQANSDDSDVEATVHQIRKRPTKHLVNKNHSLVNDVNLDDKEADISDQDRPRSTDTLRPESTIERAVGEMVKMQTQMTEVLKNVSDVLVSALSPKQQELPYMETDEHNNNNCKDRSTLALRDRRQAGDDRYEGLAQHRQNARILYNQRQQRCHSNIKIPPFTGKEEWTVWINRFEAIAERQDWTNEEKLDHLLPKLEGTAAEFVYTQLKRDMLRDYDGLISEINYRFRVIETPKNFAVKFSKRDQRQNETVEEYATELKRLYDKAYKERDRRTRREDLVRRFMDGLRDEDLSWEVEYIKEPSDIDEAVYHVVTCIQTRKRHRYEGGDRRKRFGFREQQHEEKRDQTNHAYRVPAKTEQNEVSSKNNSSGSSTDQTRPVELRSGDPKNQMDAGILQQILKKLSELTQSQQQIKTHESSKTGNRRSLVCYTCNQENHFARDCPYKDQYRGPRRYPMNGGDRKSRPLNPHATPFNQAGSKY